MAIIALPKAEHTLIQLTNQVILVHSIIVQYNQYFSDVAQYSSMITQAQILKDYRKVYNELDEVVNTYHENFEQIFNLRQCALIQQLEERATKLKYEIADLKKETSHQALSVLISKKKQEREAERLKLDMSWRELTEKLKKLQEEDKKLMRENLEFKFDIENLQLKIQQLATENANLSHIINNIQPQKLKSIINTEPKKKQYVSPYRLNLSSKSSIKQESTQKYSQIVQRKLGDVRAMKQVPSNLLMEFLSNAEVKGQIYEILQAGR